MANINKDVPNTPDPNYLGYARPISQPTGDKSLGVALAGLGNAIKEGVAATDFLVKEKISDAVDAGVDTTRDIFTAGLESMDGKAAPSLTAQDPSEFLPNEVKSVGNNITDLRTAMNAGKISPTAYYGKLTAIAKQLRSQYPGYRDFIDSQISQAAGVNPANAYMKSLMSDINTRASSSTALSNKMFSFIQKEAPELAPGVLAGKMTMNQAYVEATTRAAQGLELQRRKALRDDMQGQREDLAVASSDDANLQAANTVHNYLNTITLNAGLQSPQTLDQLNQGLATGTLKLSDAEATTLGQQIMAQRTVAANYLRSKFMEIDPKTGKSLLMGLKGGATEMNTIINQNLQAMDSIAKNIMDKDTGAAFYHARMVPARIADQENNLQTNKDVGAYFAQIGALNKLGGPQFSQQFFVNMLQSDLDKKYKNYLHDQIIKMQTQTVPKKDDLGNWHAESTPQPITLKTTLQEDLSRGIKNVPQLYKEYLDHLSKIGDPNYPDAAKLKLATAAFSDNDLGVLSYFQEDTTDPVTGRRIPGKYYVFNKLTSPSVTQSMKRLADTYGANLWVQYKGFAETEFGRELFGQAIRNLQAVQGSPNVQISYNSDTHQFSYKYHASLDRPPDIVTAPGGVNPLVRNSIDNLNLGLRSIVNIAKTEGSDPDAYLLGLFRQIGFTPDPKSIQGLPQQMINALATAHHKASLAEQVLGDNTFNTKTKGKTSERIPPNEPIVTGAK